MRIKSIGEKEGLAMNLVEPKENGRVEGKIEGFGVYRFLLKSCDQCLPENDAAEGIQSFVLQCKKESRKTTVIVPVSAMHLLTPGGCRALTHGNCVSKRCKFHSNYLSLRNSTGVSAHTTCHSTRIFQGWRGHGTCRVCNK